MDDETTGPTDVRPLTPYEQLCRKLYDYQFGMIGFLELLDTFEEVLRIKPPRTDHQNVTDKKE
jgi:hypothetical protein